MDDLTKQRFKWKFYKLTVLLNLIVLMAGLAVILVFLAPPPFRLAVPAALIVLALVTGLYFREKYLETKKWLDEQGKGPADQ
jgi:membrane protein implicated in regulation of membrane protease activity